MSFSRRERVAAGRIKVGNTPLEATPNPFLNHGRTPPKKNAFKQVHTKLIMHRYIVHTSPVFTDRHKHDWMLFSDKRIVKERGVLRPFYHREGGVRFLR